MGVKAFRLKARVLNRLANGSLFLMGSLFMSAILWGLLLLPRFDAGAEVSHDVGTNADLRGHIAFGVDLDAVSGHRWRLSVLAKAQNYVRDNRSDETSVRISPSQVHFPVMAALRFEAWPELELGFFVRHQSNHDIDETDAARVHETVSYELYGFEAIHRHTRAFAACYIDRGTRLSGKAQTAPFDYGLWSAGLQSQIDLWRNLYSRVDFRLTGHQKDENREGSLNFRRLDLDAQLEFGWRFEGIAANWRLFLRGWRIEAYRYLGDSPQHLLTLGLGVGP